MGRGQFSGRGDRVGPKTSRLQTSKGIAGGCSVHIYLSHLEYCVIKGRKVETNYIAIVYEGLENCLL